MLLKTSPEGSRRRNVETTTTRVMGNKNKTKSPVDISLAGKIKFILGGIVFHLFLFGFVRSGIKKKKTSADFLSQMWAYTALFCLLIDLYSRRCKTPCIRNGKRARNSLEISLFCAANHQTIETVDKTNRCRKFDLNANNRSSHTHTHATVTPIWIPSSFGSSVKSLFIFVLFFCFLFFCRWVGGADWRRWIACWFFYSFPSYNRIIADEEIDQLPGRHYFNYNNECGGRSLLDIRFYKLCALFQVFKIP